MHGAAQHRHPQHVPVRLGRAEERLIYALALGLLVSGGGWLLLEHFVRIEGDFGPAHHWSQSWLLKLHGVLGMVGVWGFGVLWIFHIRRAWKLRRHRRSGGTMFAMMLVLSISGLLLYYAGNDALRSASSLVHWIGGLIAGGALIVHVLVAPRRLRQY